MKLKVLLALAPILFILNLTDTHAQSMGVGTDSPNPNAILHLVSPGNNQGLMIPKLTTAERTAASFVNNLSSEENGLMVFDSDESAFYYWQNDQWVSLKTAVNISAGSGINIANGVVTNTGDLDATNEIQDISLSGTDLSISNGSTINLSAIDTDTRLTESEVDALVANNGFLTASDVTGYDTDASDDFDGDFNSLSNIPSDLADGDQINDADADPTNELITGISLETGNILRITEGGTNNDIDLSSLATGGSTQDLSFDGTNLNITDGTGIDISSWDTDVSDDFDGNYNSLANTPTLLSHFTNDAGYVTSADDADADLSNELITSVSLEAGNILRITEAGTNNDVDLSSISGSAQNLSFDGTNLNISDGTGIDISGWDTDQTDDFDGNYSSLSGAPTNLSEFTNDAGFITSADDADASSLNELNTSGTLIGTTLRIIDAGGNIDVDLSTLQDGVGTDDQTALEVSVTPASGVTSTNVQAALEELQSEIAAGGGGDMLESIYDTNGDDVVDDAELVNGLTVETAVPAGAVFTDTQLTEGEVDAFVADNGYLTSEIDGSTTNEIQDLQLASDILTITNNGSATPIDLSAYLDNTDTQLTEAEVDAFVADNGYLTSEVDGSTTNEIQDLQLATDILTITNNGSATPIDLSAYLDNTDTQLTESEVDAFVANNGYLSTEVDGSTTNELITSGTLLGTTLRISDAGGNTDVDLSSLLDGTGTDDQNAAEVSVTPANGVSSTNVQDALEELQGEIASAGGGDMLESVYDINGDNVVDDAELVNGLTVETAVPSGAVFTDTQLTEGEVDAFVANNGYLSTEVDGSTTNELITSGTLLGTTLRISDAGGNTDVDLSSLQDGTGTDDQNAAEVSVTPANGVSSTNVQDALEELQGEIASAGGGDMLESVYDINGDNVVDDAELVNGLTVETAVPSGAVFTDTQLTEAEVDAFVANNGFISSEVDGSTTNEIQDLQLATDILTITNNGSATPIDLSTYLDNTDTQLTEAEVDAFVADNGYLTSEVDGSTTNEIQDLQIASDILTITNNGSATPIDLSAYLDDTDTQLTEAEVDAFVANNGYLSNEVDGSTTNELITSGTLLGTTLRISDAGGNTDVDLSSLQDGTGTDNQSLSFDGSNINISGGTGIDVSSWDTDAGDDFDGNYSSLSGAPTTLSSFTNDAGFITSPDDADASATNELIQSATLLGTTLRIRDAGANNDVDLASLVDDSDADATNELITSAGMSGDVLRINEGSNNWNVDLSQFNNDLPDQAGQSGRFLSTNGTSPSWQAVPSSPWSLNGSEVYYNSGIVGIGTSTPSASYQTTLATTMSRNIWIDNNYNGSATTYGIVYSGPSSGSGTNYGHYVSGEDLNYFSGDLAIGTPNSSSKLTVLKTESAATNTLASFLEAGGSDASILFSSQSVNEFSMGVDATNSAFKISDNSELGTNDRFSIATNGSVAVGTGSPNTTYQFEVEQTTHTRGIHVDNNFSGSSNTYAIYLSIASTATGANYGIYSSGEDRNYFSGNVGIGTTAPSEKLDVVGNIELNGNLISKASGTTSVNLDADGILPTPTRRILRVRNTGSSRADVLGIGAGEDGQELIIVNVENAYQVGTGGAPTLNDGEAYQVRFYGPSANDWGINTEDTKLLLSSYYFTMYGGSTLHLMYDATLNAWIEISRSENKESAQLN